MEDVDAAASSVVIQVPPDDDGNAEPTDEAAEVAVAEAAAEVAVAEEEKKSLLTRFLTWQPPTDAWYIKWARRSKLPALKEAAKKDIHVIIR
jgi:hypothetical protein